MLSRDVAFSAVAEKNIAKIFTDDNRTEQRGGAPRLRARPGRAAHKDSRSRRDQDREQRLVQSALKRATSWAHDVLRDAEVSAQKRPQQAMRTLRRAKPELDRVSARYLVDRVAGRPVESTTRPAWRRNILM